MGTHSSGSLYTDGFWWFTITVDRGVGGYPNKLWPLPGKLPKQNHHFH